jgi:tetratricopeptide (TPR) repeat protein
MFVKAGQDATVAEIYLIDLATYQQKSLFFFDHAYLELATMLRQMDQIGERRWLEFATALSCDANQPLEPNERGWLEDILAARTHVFGLASKSYPDRMDDLKLQFLLAHVAAGLAFLHKVPRQGTGSGGLSASQYRQSFVWSAVFLRRFFNLQGLSVEQACRYEARVPVLGKSPSSKGPVPSAADWQSVKYFDAQGFNILVVPKPSSPIPPEILSLPWTLVIDFREQTPTENEFKSMDRAFRQTWPGEPLPDPKFLTRGGLWYFANSRSDLSGVEPTTTPIEWRRRYRRCFDDLLVRISETISPIDVRTLILADGFSSDHVRFLGESLDTAFHSALAPIVVASQKGGARSLDGITTILSALDAAIIALRGARAAAPAEVDTAFLPCRQGADVRPKPVPPDLLARVSRDLTVLFRSRAQVFPPDRVFGVDFRRGMPIEWAELAQNLDVPRSGTFDRYYKQIDEALTTSSNRTINLMHEPSAGGTTLSRRLAWEFMEKFPVVSLDQISTDTASYLRDVSRFCSLPVLVVMESTVVTESEREGLLQQLREDNTRAAFLWLSRAYGHGQNKNVLSGKLDEAEAALFLDVYLEQVTDDTRRAALQRLSTSYELQDQRNPFFFGLTAFGENFLGIDRLIHDVVDGAPGTVDRALLSDLALVSLYSNDGFPLNDFEELCTRVNGGKWPVDKGSLFLLATSTHVRVSHAVLAEKALAALARNKDRWRADLPLFSDVLLGHLASLEHKISDRIQEVVKTLFITRDFESALQADTDVQAGGIPTQRRFSPLINDLGNVTQARRIFKRVVQLWPKEPHFAAHLARHLLYEEPKEIDEAIQFAKRAASTPHAATDASLVHVVGMAYRVRMEQRLREARNEGLDLKIIEDRNQADFQEAIDHFEKATDIKPGSEHGLVAIIQTITVLLGVSMEIAKARDLGEFLRAPSHGWYLDTLARAEDSIDVLRNRPHSSIRAQKTIAEWYRVYGRFDKVISDLRVLASRYEDVSIRRALCSAIVARSKHKWNSIAQGDLRTIALMMERNINQQGVRDADVRQWLAAYRRMAAFDINLAIERLMDWHNLRPTAVEPVFYLYVFYFLRWLTAPAPREGLAAAVNEWLKFCQANRALGERSWSYEWLEPHGHSYRIVHFKDLQDLGLDPPSIIRIPNHPDRRRLESRLARINGTMRAYQGPQNAMLDLGQKVMVRITPLDRLSKEDEGEKVSAFVSFSYDGIVGWDPALVVPEALATAPSARPACR